VKQKSSSSKETTSRFKEFLIEIPKTEIHLHLEAIASVSTIWALMKKHNITLQGISTKKQLADKFNITSLDEFIDLFINVIQNCFQSEEDLELLIEDAETYLQRNNIVYAEIFFAPTKMTMNGLEFSGMVKTLHEGAKKIKRDTAIEIKFIIDVSRSFGVENAMTNLEKTLEFRNDSVIGIGLGGAEAQGPARDFKAVFEKAIANDLHAVAHAGEDVGPESIWEAIQILHASRIGHGISAIQDEKLMDFLKEKKIPLEICPTSNLFTKKYVSSLVEHPIKPFFHRGLIVTLNTDDPTLFSVGLIDEYLHLLEANVFTPDELVTIVKNGIFSTFLPEKKKKSIIRDVDLIYKKRKGSF
jgi:adenosine deaminase